MWLKTCKWSKVAKIVVTAVIALLMVLDIFYVANSMKPKSTTSGKTTTTATPTSSAKNSGTTTATPSSGYTTFADECLDANKGITMYSLCELKGWQLETLATQNGYKVVSNDTSMKLYRASDGAAIVAANSSGALSESAFQALDKGASGSAVEYIVLAPYYDSLDSSLNSMFNCVKEDSQYFSDGSYGAVVYGPSMTSYLVFAGKTDSGVTYMFYNKTALANGMVSYGSTIDEVWKNMTGRAVGANH